MTLKSASAAEGRFLQLHGQVGLGPWTARPRPALTGGSSGALSWSFRKSEGVKPNQPLSFKLLY